MGHFISRAGPDKPANEGEPDVPDIRLIKSLPLKGDPYLELDRIQGQLNGAKLAVLYRLTRASTGRFYVQRQQRPEMAQRATGEPVDTLPIGYFIVTTPAELVGAAAAPDQQALTDAVKYISRTFGQKGPPDPAGPH